LTGEPGSHPVGTGLGAAGGAVPGAAGNHVSIAAEIKKEREEKHGRSPTKETYHGSVSRGFTLGSDVEESTAAAKREDGVLRLTLPKRQGSTSRTLKIEWMQPWCVAAHGAAL
jgi:hypothetical protein